jgi:AraC-like DNA-binding protein
LIDSTFTESLHARALARAPALSPAPFSREFRRVFRDPPHRYLMIRRLEHTALLLRTTEHPFGEICRPVGLSSVKSFTTMFGQTQRSPPTAAELRMAPGWTTGPSFLYF